METHKKIDFLKYSAELDNSPTFICFPETKFGKCIENSVKALPVCTLYCHDRDLCGGGTATYCSADVNSTAVIDLPSSVDTALYVLVACHVSILLLSAVCIDRHLLVLDLTSASYWTLLQRFNYLLLSLATSTKICLSTTRLLLI